MGVESTEQVYDYIIVGSGFGGSVSAMRLAEKGYRVLVLERGKRFGDQDFARRNWNVRKYLWAPAVGCYGILQISLFKDVWVLHGSGVGGGSLGYANVLMEPDESAFANPAWKIGADWPALLRPHYATAKKMLGVATNQRAYPADHILSAIARQIGAENTFRTTTVGVFFGKDGETEGQEVADPYFDGQGPVRNTCIYCGGCMVGCRNNAKNTLVKNYLYFAEKKGVQVWAECEVRDVRPLPADQADGARYEVAYRRVGGWPGQRERSLRARQVILAAGALGTLRLLFRCRDITRSLARLSPQLGECVRTNSETLLGVSARDHQVDFSKGVAITSIFNPDGATAIEPVRYPAGSSLLRFLAAPVVDSGKNVLVRAVKALGQLLRHPRDFLRMYLLPGWARRTTILLVMQTEDNQLRLRLGRQLLTGFRRGLVSRRHDTRHIPNTIASGHQVSARFAEEIKGFAASSVNETFLDVPITAHILGGCPCGPNVDEGVVDMNGQVYHYPGLFVVDGSIIPANPGVNPSLTITAMAEYLMSKIPDKDGREQS